MFKKLIYILIISSTFLSYNQSFARTPLRDELPPLERLSDLTIGVKRIEKGLKYEKKNKIKKAQKMFNEAITFLLKANKNREINSDIYFYLGFAYNKINNQKNAIIYYNLGLVINPKDVNINKHLGNIYLNNNNILEAKKLLKNIKNCNCNEYIELKSKIDKFN